MDRYNLLNKSGSVTASAAGKKPIRLKVTKGIINLVLIIYCLSSLLPFYFLFVRSFVPTAESAKLHLWVPEAKNVSMEAVIGNLATYYNLDLKAFKKDMGIRGYLNPQLTLNEIVKKYNIPSDKVKDYFSSFYIYNGWKIILLGGKFIKSISATVFIVALSILFGSLLSLATGSVLARFTKRWHMYIYNIYMLQIIIPVTMIMLPLYLIVTRYLHLDNTYAALILLNVQGGALPTMIFTSHIATIPGELRESVEIDGGNRLQYFFKIVVPLSKVAIAAYTCIRIPAYWNELLNGFLFLKTEKYPLIPFISSLTGTYNTNFQAIYSGLVISLIPMVIFYLFFQDSFVNSIMVGSVKG